MRGKQVKIKHAKIKHAKIKHVKIKHVILTGGEGVNEATHEVTG